MHTEFFLGANSGSGFYSLYGEFCKDKGDILYLIKAGPGGGKSGFMRHMGLEAERRGFDTEYILCSGDPASLDGVYIPALHLGFADATSPHVIEPAVFGVDSYYVNLGQFCSVSDNELIRQYTGKYKEMYSAAYSYLSAAASVHGCEIPELIGKTEKERAKRRALGTVKRELKGAKSDGKITKRFISCISCAGDIVLNDTVLELCKLIYALDDRFGLEQTYLNEVYAYCRERGIAAVVCPSPLCPDELDAVLVPEKGIAFIRLSMCGEHKPYRHVRLDALIPSERIRARKAEIRQREKLFSSAADAAHFYLSEAKRYHDMLEKEYKPLVDFERLNRFRDEFVRELFSFR